MYTHESGASQLGVIVALSMVLGAMMVLVIASMDVIATMHRAQHGADMLAIAALEASPLAGGKGEVNHAALTHLAQTHDVALTKVDTTGWPLEVAVTIRAQPRTIMHTVWAGPTITQGAELVSP